MALAIPHTVLHIVAKNHWEAAFRLLQDIKKRLGFDFFFPQRHSEALVIASVGQLLGKGCGSVDLGFNTHLFFLFFQGNTKNVMRSPTALVYVVLLTL